MCKEYEEEIFSLYEANYSYKGISFWLRDRRQVVISPDSISKYIKRNYQTEALTGVVEAPKQKDEPESTPERDTLVELGYDPDSYYIHASKVWGKDGSLNRSYDIRLLPTAEPIAEEPRLDLLFAEASKRKDLRRPTQGVKNEIANVVVWADAQTGKVDKLGGVAEQRDRIWNILSQVNDYVTENVAEKALFLDAGDGVEGFENTAAQMFTNQLSLMDQIDLEATYEQSYIEALALRHEEVEVYGIDSNHCKWRNGKSNLGLPKDDWGRFIKRQLAKAFEMNPYMTDRVSFNEPGDWDRTLRIDLWGRGIGLAHGDQVNSIDGIPKWWAGQGHGGLEVADTELLITGHFHHFLLRQTGRHINGTQKYHIGAPTLDNGSSWYEGQSGESSDPGLIIFQFDKLNGFNFDSLTMLREKK